MIIERRGFIMGLGAMGLAAPSIVRASSLMTLKGENLYKPVYYLTQGAGRSLLERWTWDPLLQRITQIETTVLKDEAAYWQRLPHKTHNYGGFILYPTP